MKQKLIPIFSWIAALWTANVFLSSLPYKFSKHPDTEHIFGTIGTWMKGVLGDAPGQLFIDYGAYTVGTAELVTSVVLLFPILLLLIRKTQWASRLPDRSFFHGIGGIMAGLVMSGAAFFHLFTPLGIEVLHNGKSDNGSLFYAAVSILILGFMLGTVNLLQWKAGHK